MGVERAGTVEKKMGFTGATWLGWDMGRGHDRYLGMALTLRQLGRIELSVRYVCSFAGSIWGS